MIQIIENSLNSREEIFAKAPNAIDVSGAVREIIEKVRREGDRALYYSNERFDKAKLNSLKVSAEEIEEGLSLVPCEFIGVLELARDNITEFHKMQRREGFALRKDGTVIGQRVIPIERAGLYVPGGTAAYPSTVLMDAIPAKIAGCERIVMVTPPGRDGKINPVILAAAKISI